MREHTRVRVILRLLHHGHRCHNVKHHAAFVSEDTLVCIRTTTHARAQFVRGSSTKRALGW